MDRDTNRAQQECSTGRVRLMDGLATLDGAGVALGRGGGSTRNGYRSDEEGQEGGNKENERGVHFSSECGSA